MIGVWGDVIFSVSEKQLQTFDNFKRTETARWSKHDIHGQKQKSEFLGLDVGKISFTMHFSAYHGVNPRDELNKFIKRVRSGEAHTLIIGNERVGVNKWYIPSVDESWNYVDNRGNVLTADLNVTMEEYV